MSARAVRYKHRELSGKKFNEQAMCALIAKVGRKYAHLVVIDFPVRVIRVLVEDAEKYSTEIDMTSAEMTARLLEAGERMGCTKGARTLLEETA